MGKSLEYVDMSQVDRFSTPANDERAPSSTVDTFVTNNGGEGVAWAVTKAGGEVGFETAKTRPPAEYSVEFCDFPFTDESATYEDHLETVRREQPKVAVAPDLDESRSPAEVYRKADELGQWASVVIVVPKSVHPSEVPDRYRVGVPLANFGEDESDTEESGRFWECDDRYSGDTLKWSWTDFGECNDLHLLGGSPSIQREFSKYVGGVSSVDGASVIKGASVGNVWGPTPRRDWHPTGKYQKSYYARIRMSVSNIIKSWEADRAGYEPDYEIPVDGKRYSCQIEDAQEQVQTEQSYRVHGARGACRYIEADDADCLSPQEREEMEMEVVNWTRKQASKERMKVKGMSPEMSPADDDQQQTLCEF